MTVFRVVNTPDYLVAVGWSPLNAEVKLLLGTFRDDWSIGLVLFGIPLVLLGYLIYRSGYIPRLLGFYSSSMGWAG